MTNEFMQNILSGQFWMLKSADIRAWKLCAFPPKKKALAKMLTDVMKKHKVNADYDLKLRRTIELIEQKPPAKEWMLKVLCQFDPDHVIFTKEWTREMARE